MAVHPYPLRYSGAGHLICIFQVHFYLHNKHSEVLKGTYKVDSPFTPDGANRAKFAPVCSFSSH
jgi:hypothetical protein